MNYSTFKKLDKWIWNIEAMVRVCRLKIITKLIGSDLKVISNITITSDIIDYNKLYYDDCLLVGNHVKRVSDRQSFVYNPSNVTNVG